MPKARCVSSLNPSRSAYRSPNIATAITIANRRSRRTAFSFGPAGRFSPPGVRLVPPGCCVEGILCHPDRGGVHHLPLDAYGPRTGPVRLLVRPHDLSRPGDLLLRGREDLVYDGHLRGVDAPLAVE